MTHKFRPGTYAVLGDNWLLEDHIVFIEDLGPDSPLLALTYHVRFENGRKDEVNEKDLKHLSDPPFYSIK